MIGMGTQGMESSDYGRIIAMVAKNSPHALGQVLAALGQARGKGMQTDIGGMVGGEETGEAPEKFLGALLPILAQYGPTVIGAALPHVLRLFGARKGFEVGGEYAGEYGGEEAPEKIIGTVLPILAQHGPHVVRTALPHILRLVARRKAFEGFGETVGEGIGADKALNLWRTIRNVAPQAARFVLPLVVNALRKEYQPGYEGEIGGGTEWTKGFEAEGVTNVDKAFNLWRTIRNVAPQAARFVLPIVMNALRKEYSGAEGEIAQAMGGIETGTTGGNGHRL